LKQRWQLIHWSTVYFWNNSILLISIAIMYFPVLCTLLISVVIFNIGYTDGSTCQCFCCLNSTCNTTHVGDISTSSCSNCTDTLCESTYNSTCNPTNGTINSSCITSDGIHILFEPIYGTLAMIIISFLILIYQRIEW